VRCCGRFAEKAEAAYARAAANASEYRRKLYELIEQRARDLLLAAVAAAELTDETREQLERLLNVHFEADRRLRG
jgi:type II secretory pathway predicted ATPase ExeA